VAQKAADLIAAAIMVSGGFGTALLPESTLRLRLPGVVFRPLIAEVDCMIDLHCAYRRDEESPLLEKLLECARADTRDAGDGAARTPDEAGKG
jgi:DNA-binding transcriptional LysR family regulator